MKTMLLLLVLATSASAQTRIAFTTAAATFVDEAQKQREQAVTDLRKDFTGRAKKDNVAVTDPSSAQILVTVLAMRRDPNGEATTCCDVKRSGVYRCYTCDNQLRLDAGEEAPSCVHCNGAPVTWVFVRPLVGPIGFTS